ncbi:hypothetical protein [Sphingomonas sp.]|uniref:hypothetical protein n=1 Tax=Sphingomonas sp. TaxID=28214 RepID=UPI003BAC95FB
MAQPTSWHRTPAAQALLASCAANPPAYLTRRLASHERWTRDDETASQFDPNDDRVDALHLISGRACETAMRACGENREALRKLVYGWPHVDHVIADAIEAAGRGVAA